LKALCDVGVLREVKAGREKLFIHPNLITAHGREPQGAGVSRLSDCDQGRCLTGFHVALFLPSMRSRLRWAIDNRPHERTPRGEPVLVQSRRTAQQKAPARHRPIFTVELTRILALTSF
jgi:hypothetical protein